MRNNSRSRLSTVVIIIALIIILGFLYLKFRREHTIWDENISLLNGDTIKVHHHYSERTIYGPPHFWFGGGGEKYKVRFSYRNKDYNWRCLYLPIVIEFWNNAVYSILFDREKFSDLKLRFFKYDNEFTEITKKEFPKQIAIQNRWIREVEVSYRKDLPFEKYEINPENKEFRRSFTAKIWYILEKGVSLNDIESKEIDKEFLIDYKKKYIDPYWGDKLK